MYLKRNKKGGCEMMSVGSRIKQLRTERKLTQEELANNLNKRFDIKINKGMISKWESDISEPRLDHAKSMAEYFDVSLDYLIGLSDDIKPIKDEKLLSEIEILTQAAHKVGHDGPLSDSEIEKIKLAIQIALVKGKK